MMAEHNRLGAYDVRPLEVFEIKCVHCGDEGQFTRNKKV